jgi:Zn-dependent metalloprotease
MPKHWKLNQSNPRRADWLFGNGLFYKHEGILNVMGLRSLSNPNAYGQPNHFSCYDEQNGYDNGGVHHNSGIPNRAFYLVVCDIGLSSWSVVGEVWYKSMTSSHLERKATFKDFANQTLRYASWKHRDAFRKAWESVGVL